MKDVTREVPIKRMSVVRGSLVDIKGRADMGLAEGAAKMAAKGASQILPDLHPVALTHVQVDFAETEAGLDVTVTVQAQSRIDLEHHAMAGAMGALLTLRQAVGGRIADVHVVQNVA